MLLVNSTTSCSRYRYGQVPSKASATLITYTALFTYMAWFDFEAIGTGGLLPT
jgi:hypothetical protein